MVNRNWFTIKKLIDKTEQMFYSTVNGERMFGTQSGGESKWKEKKN